MFHKYERILSLTLLMFFGCVVFATAQSRRKEEQMPDAKSIYNNTKSIVKDSYYFKLHAVFIQSGTTVADEVSKVIAPKTDGLVSYPFPTVLLARNGEPISNKDIERQRKDVAKRLAKYEESAGKSLVSPQSRAKVFQQSSLLSIRLPLYQFQPIRENDDTMEFTDLHKEMLNGRECYVFISRYRADADFDYLNKYGKDIKDSIINSKQDEYIRWVDVVDNQTVRTELYKLGQAEKFIGKSIVKRENAAFTFVEFIRIKEGRWMPKRILSEIKDATGKVIASTEYSYSDYKFFDTEVKGATVNPKTP